MKATKSHLRAKVIDRLKDAQLSCEKAYEFVCKDDLSIARAFTLDAMVKLNQAIRRLAKAREKGRAA